MNGFIKICGVTKPEDAAAVAKFGADAIGINFWPGSKRFVEDLGLARAIADAAPHLIRVGIFVNQPIAVIDPIVLRVGLDRVQLHGDEPEASEKHFGERLIRAVRLAAESDLAKLDRLPDAVILIDAQQPNYGGGGDRIAIDLAAKAARKRDVILAGGLDPENVTSAIRQIRPAGVDVASGVESAPGAKDHSRVGAFIARARSIPRKNATMSRHD